MLPAAAMYHSFSPNMVRPNLPLRKPSSSPMSVATAAAPQRRLLAQDAPERPASGAIGDGELMPSLPHTPARLTCCCFLFFFIFFLSFLFFFCRPYKFTSQHGCICSMYKQSKVLHLHHKSMCSVWMKVLSQCHFSVFIGVRIHTTSTDCILLQLLWSAR